MDRHQVQSFVKNPRVAQSIRRSLAADESNNMLEVLRGDEGTSMPPAPTNIRVRDMGRNIKERFEVCQWIQDMTLEPTAPKRPGPESTKYSGPTETADFTPLASVDTPAASQGVAGIGDHAHVAAENLAESGETVISFAEQLDAIRQQQLQLLERQKAIQEQLEKRKGSSEGSSCCVVPGTEQKDHVVTVQKCQRQTQQGQITAQEEVGSLFQSTTDQVKANGLLVKPRRLKGSLASGYAKRDEGVVGTLLWVQGGDETNPATVSSGRPANMRHDNSSSVSELLSQTSFVSTRSYQGSETSVTSTAPRQATPARTARLSDHSNEKPIITGHDSQKSDAEQHNSSFGDEDGDSECASSKCETATA